MRQEHTARYAGAGGPRLQRRPDLIRIRFMCCTAQWEYLSHHSLIQSSPVQTFQRAPRAKQKALQKAGPGSEVSSKQ